jgi:hypothetical protein
MKLGRASLAAILAGLSVLGCHGNSPTSSSSGFQIAIIATLANSAMAPTIVEAQVLLDGTAVEDTGTEVTPAPSFTFTPAGFAAAGPHTLQLQIVSQTTSPNSYTVNMPFVRVFDLNGTLLKSIQLSTQTASLATGGTINYSFSL